MGSKIKSGEFIHPAASPNSDTRHWRLQAVLFAVAFLGTLFLASYGIDKFALRLLPEFKSQAQRSDSARQNKAYFESLKASLGDEARFLTDKSAAREAKANRQFWASNIEGRGMGADVLNDKRAFDSLFPGYGRALQDDKTLWREYFQLPFGPASFLNSEPAVAQAGLSVAYSWPGCFRIYEKYGADVLVFGSSEVYDALVPGQLASKLQPMFSTPPRILFCVTQAMPMEAVQQTTQELLRVSSTRPGLIIWGYSFWLAYTGSSKMEGYKNDKKGEYQQYLDARNNWGSMDHSSSKITDALTMHKVADFFPSVTWDNLLRIKLDTVRSLLRARKAGNADAEGIEISREVADMPDAGLANYLDTNLKPYYSITSGISGGDCSMEKAEALFEETIDQMKRLSPNVYVYLAPTSLHHRRTVPECFLPNVNKMLIQSARKKQFSLLNSDAAGFGLDNRSFIFPMAEQDKFYFNINHTNYAASLKVTNKLADWIRANHPVTRNGKD